MPTYVPELIHKYVTDASYNVKVLFTDLGPLVKPPKLVNPQPLTINGTNFTTQISVEPDDFLGNSTNYFTLSQIIPIISIKTDGLNYIVNIPQSLNGSYYLFRNRNHLVANEPSDVSLSGGITSLAVFGGLGAIIIASTTGNINVSYCTSKDTTNPILRLNSFEFLLNSGGQYSKSGYFTPSGTDHKYRQSNYIIKPEYFSKMMIKLGNADRAAFIESGSFLQSPKETRQIEYRYKAYEKSHTSGLNNPNSLLLNGRVNRFNAALESMLPQIQTYGFNGSGISDWTINGNPDYFLTAQNNPADSDNNLVIQITDPDDSFRLDDLPPYLSHPIDLTYKSDIFASFRVNLETNPDLSRYDGVFTGVGFGISNGANVVVAGFLSTEVTNHSTAVSVANSLKHAYNAHHKSLDYHNARDFSDQITYRDAHEDYEVEALTGILIDKFSTHFSNTSYHNMSSTCSPTGSTFKKLNTIRSLWNDHIADGTVHKNRDMTNTVPNPRQVGICTDWTNNGLVSSWISTESDWTVPHSYLLSLGVDGNASLFISGENTPRISMPPNTALKPSDVDFSLNNLSQVFSGSLSRRAQAQSYWAFGRAATYPVQLVPSNANVDAKYDWNALPIEQTPPWYMVGNEHEEIFNSTSKSLTIDSMSMSDSSDDKYGILNGPYLGYIKPEPSLNTTSSLIWDFKVRCTSYNFMIDNKSAGIHISDGNYLVSLVLMDTTNVRKTLSYYPSDIPVFPWAYEIQENYDVSIRDEQLVFENISDTKTINKNRSLFSIVNNDTVLPISSTNYDLEFGVYVYDSPNPGSIIGLGTTYSIHPGLLHIDEGFGHKNFEIRFLKVGSTRHIGVFTYTSSNTPSIISSIPYDWSFKQNRIGVKRSSTDIQISVDGNSLLPVALTLMQQSKSISSIYFGSSEALETVGKTRWSYITFMSAIPQSTKMIGIYKGGNHNDIQSYVTAPCDWSTDKLIRIVRDPSSAVRVYLEGAQDPVIEIPYLSSYLPPSDGGWFKNFLPSDRYVAFGHFDPSTAARVTFSNVFQYTINRIPKRPLSQYRMLLNQQSVVASGEHCASKSYHYHHPTVNGLIGAPPDEFVANNGDVALTRLNEGTVPEILIKSQSYSVVDELGDINRVSKLFDPLIDLASSVNQDQFDQRFMNPEGNLVLPLENPDWEYINTKVWKSSSGDLDMLSPYDSYFEYSDNSNINEEGWG